MKAKRTTWNRVECAGAGAALAAGAFPATTLAASAARVEFAVGDVQIVAPGGQVRSPQKGDQVDNGETVSTNHGRAQLRFSDGAYVSLQPQSDFRIDDYRFAGKADGSKRGFFSLLKGGLRTITGIIGRTNKKNYQVSTPVATIGIRGTEYTVAYTSSIAGSVGEGEIEVCTLRCVPFASGESFYVANPHTLPQLTFKKTDLPPPQPDNAAGGSFGDQNNPGQDPGGTVLVSGDNVGPGGRPIGILFAGAPATAPPNSDGSCSATSGSGCSIAGVVGGRGAGAVYNLQVEGSAAPPGRTRQPVATPPASIIVTGSAAFQVPPRPQ